MYSIKKEQVKKALTLTAAIPMRMIGPMKIVSDEVNEEVFVPLATLETPLWPSTARGARVTLRAGGIRATLVDERMTRSVLLESDSIVETHILEFHGEKRGDLYFTKDMLLAVGDRYESVIAANKQSDAKYR